MLKKIISDLKAPKNRYSIPNKIHTNVLEKYYFDFEEKRISKGKDQALLSKFDKNGIPLNKTYIDVKSKEYFYSPISIGQMGLSVFHTYLKTRKEEDKTRFLKFPQWYYENANTDPELGVRWLTDVPLPQYKNPGPWQSAFSQSRGISILLRGYQLTGKEEYAEMAEKALLSFTKPVKEGGVSSFTDWGPFYEEYTASVPVLVLNGMIFSLCGVYDFIRTFPSHKLARKIFDNGVKTLINIIPQFDLGYWSRYNLCKAEWYPNIDPATRTYQRLHIIQMDLMYKITRNKIFEKYFDIFDKQDNLINALKAYRIKYFALKKIGRL